MNIRYNRAWLAAKRAALLTRCPQCLYLTLAGWRYDTRAPWYAIRAETVTPDYLLM